MKLKVFIAEQTKGWKQVTVPTNLQTHSQVISWAGNICSSNECKRFLITENPHHYPMSSR